MTKKKTQEQTLTRAEKTDAAKKIILQLLKKASYKSIELIEKAAQAYAEKYENGDSSNDVKGRIGSVLDVMKKDGEVVFEGGRYEMKPDEKPKKHTVKAETETKTKTPAKATKKTKTKKAESVAPALAVEEQPAQEEKTETKVEQPKQEEVEAPMQTEEKPKKRGRKPKAKAQPVSAEEEKQEQPQPQVEEKQEAPQAQQEQQTQVAETPAPIAQEEKTQEEVKTDKQEQTTPAPETQQPQEQPKAQAKPQEDNSPKGTLMDMSFLIGSVKPTAKEKQDEKKLAPQPVSQPVSQPAPETPQPAPQAVNPRTDVPKKAETEKKAETAEKSVEAEKTEQVQKPTAQAPVKPQQKPQPKPQQKPQEQKQKQAQPKPQQKQTEDKLQERFLERLHKLGGEYFEYYSVYLLERYSRQNGRRLEALRISGGGNDGGIDGEIELTDKLGFRETIYIQAKNWDAEKGNKKLWIVGETLLQQFLGACAYRQAKDGKQNCRGIFITTSKFTPEARKMLDVMSDKIVGYDGTDLFETAKECGYGIVKKNGEWTLDEELLSGGNAFFKVF